MSNKNEQSFNHEDVSIIDVFNDSKLTYIELSDGRVGYVEDVDNEQFKSDLKRLNLTYETTTASAYNRYMILNKLSPEQVYHQVMSGKKEFKNRWGD